MNDIQATAVTKIKEWFSKAANWQKDLYSQLWQGNDDNDKLKFRAFSLAKMEYLNESSEYTPTTDFPSEISFSGSDSHPIILKSISDVQGVGALSPTRPLEFGTNLTIVYGENGCGKSSYVRILKSAASPQNADAIIGNIYEQETVMPQAKLIYSDDGEEKTFDWKPNMTISCPLHIYDSSVAKRFAEDKNEIIYEPRLLSIVSSMANVYENVKHELEEMDRKNNANVTPLDNAISGNKLIVEFKSISQISQYDKFIENNQWGGDEQTQLDAMLEALHHHNPGELLKALKAKKNLIEDHYNAIFALIGKTGDSVRDKYLSQRENQIETKAVADAFLEGIRSIAVLEKTGSAAWKKLWSASIRFADEASGESKDTTVVNGKCVLCQQDVVDDAAHRMKEFSEYMTSSAEKNAEYALNAFKASVDAIQDVNSKINIEQIELVLQSGGISENYIQLITKYYKTIKLRCKWLLEYDDSTTTAIPKLPDVKALNSERAKIISDYIVRIESLQKTISDRTKQVDLVNTLLARKWIFENKEVFRKTILIKKGISGCKTNNLTLLKKELAQILITSTYISRFNDEMQGMDRNNRIRVELIAKAEKGKSYHQVALRGAVQKKKTGEILSEGEFRVVSLAAFLADLSSWERTMPFIFDDPITSLDHKYEEKVAYRLVKLSGERQVIVFTHRLAFAQLLVSKMDDFKNAQLKTGQYSTIDLKQIELRNTPLGEPTEPTYHGTVKMDTALNLLNNKIKDLTKRQSNGEYEIYDTGVKELCSTLRITVEHGIETNLLSGIVTRFGQPISSLKIKYLHIITDEDINLFDDMMTKYSAYEHSQSIERPAELPELSEIEADIDKLLKWCNDFKNRKNQLDKSKKK